MHHLRLPHDPTARSRIESLLAAGATVSCHPTATGGGIIDSITCSCGWQSEPYWDDLEQALEDWSAHTQTVADTKRCTL